MKKILIIITVLYSFNSFSQGDDKHIAKVSMSVYSSLSFSQGFELKGNFYDWYIAYQAENLTHNDQNHFNWGFSIGMFKPVEKFNFSGGVRVGMMNMGTIRDMRPAYGLEAESTYDLNSNLYLGLRAGYDAYMDSDLDEEYNSENLLRGFLKLGYRLL